MSAQLCEDVCLASWIGSVISMSCDAAPNADSKTDAVTDADDDSTADADADSDVDAWSVASSAKFSATEEVMPRFGWDDCFPCALVVFDDDDDDDDDVGTSIC